jgi:hypothetical protein
MFRGARAWAIEIIAAGGQIAVLAPLYPFFLMHLLAEWLLEFAKWCLWRGDGLWRTVPAWAMSQYERLEAWKRKSLGSLQP